MRNLTICLIVFAVVFALCGVAFRSVVAEQIGLRQGPAAASQAPSGMPASFDDELY